MKKYAVMIFSILIISSTTWAEPIIIVNETQPLTEINAADVEKIYTGKKKNWENGDKVMPATLEEGDVHSSFLETALHKTPAQFATYWKRMVFTGRGQALESFASEEKLVEFVAETRGAIGYIDGATPHPGTKQVKVK